MELVGKRGALDDGESPHVLHLALGDSRVFGIIEGGVGLDQLGMLEYFHGEGLRPLTIMLHPVFVGPVEIGQSAAEYGVVERLRQRDASRCAISRSDHRVDLLGETVFEMSHHGQAPATLDLGVAWFHLFELGNGPLRGFVFFFGRFVVGFFGCLEPRGNGELPELEGGETHEHQDAAGAKPQDVDFLARRGVGETGLDESLGRLVNHAFLEKVEFSRFRIGLLLDCGKEGGV